MSSNSRKPHVQFLHAFLTFLGLQATSPFVNGFTRSSSVNKVESSMSSESAVVVKDHREAFWVFLGRFKLTASNGMVSEVDTDAVITYSPKSQAQLS